MHHRQEYQQRFLRETERLNEQQQQAVQSIEGPVMVLAGPGTGKTHILAARIGRILLETDTKPHSILCLTFTDAAVRAMRQRLLALIGPEAHRVHVFTFHSFCNHIIRENQEAFGQQGLEPLNELEKSEIIRKIIGDLPPDHPLRAGSKNAYRFAPHIEKLLDRMKAENWSTAHVHSCIDEYLRQVCSGEVEAFVYSRKYGPHEAGDLKEASIAEEEERMERLRTAAGLFPAYQQALTNYGRYDYHDMILWVLRAFREHPWLLQRYQEQYLYFLVDEYQDTNGAQNEVLHRLIDFWANPNVFIVGDDDQSIYEFQGARLKNLTNFYEKFREHLTVVVLSKNYRSLQVILDSAQALIQRNTLRVANRMGKGLTKHLEAALCEHESVSIQPCLVQYPERLQEETDLVLELERLRSEGFPLGEVAVIYARHEQAQRLTALLDRRQIPYRTRRPLNALDAPLVQNLRLLLSYLMHEFVKPFNGEPSLVNILHLACFGIAPLDLARMAMPLRKKAVDSGDRQRYWREAIADADFLQCCGVHSPDAILQLSAFVEETLLAYNSLSLPILVERVLNRSGLLRSAFAGNGDEATAPAPGTDGHLELQALFVFVSFVKSEAARQPRLTLAGLLESLRNMDERDIALPLPQPAPDKTEGRVHLLTAHSAKGLEFERVYLLDCTSANWEPARQNSRYQFPFPPTLTFTGEEDPVEARRRLFFVAMTRAKSHLQLSVSQLDGEKELQPAVFVQELLESEALAVQDRQVPEQEVEKVRLQLLTEVRPEMTPVDESLVREAIGGLSLSISALNTYLRCPLSFYYDYLLRVPQLESEEAAFGHAVHRALQLGFESMLRSENHEFPAPAVFANHFEAEITRRRASFGKKAFEQYRYNGREWLLAYCEANQTKWPRQVLAEKYIANVELEGVPLSGVIDRVDLLPNASALVVDYKTGSLDKVRTDGPSEKQPHGGIYWRQLVFYKLLFENWPGSQGKRVEAGEVSYIKPDRGRFKTSRITIGEKEAGFAAALISDTWERIHRLELYRGCGEQGCAWCSFLKRQESVLSLTHPELEMLDDLR